MDQKIHLDLVVQAIRNKQFISAPIQIASLDDMHVIEVETLRIALRCLCALQGAVASQTSAKLAGVVVVTQGHIFFPALSKSATKSDKPQEIQEQLQHFRDRVTERARQRDLSRVPVKSDDLATEAKSRSDGEEPSGRTGADQGSNKAMKSLDKFIDALAQAQEQKVGLAVPGLVGNEGAITVPRPTDLRKAERPARKTIEMAGSVSGIDVQIGCRILDGLFAIKNVPEHIARAVGDNCKFQAERVHDDFVRLPLYTYIPDDEKSP